MSNNNQYVNTIKKWMSHLGYREWKMVECDLRPTVSKWYYRCLITDKTKVEVELHPWG